jgi:hypothetical protein
LSLRPFAVAALIFLVFAGNLPAQESSFEPRVGVQQPLGDAADRWLPGYSLGLVYRLPTHSDVSFQTVALMVSRWEPNARVMLKVGGRSFEIEKNQGWRALGELTLTQNRRLLDLPRLPGALFSDVGAGLLYLRQSELEIKGYAPVGDMALTRRIYEKDKTRLGIILTGGVAVEIWERVKPRLGFKYAITKDEGFGMITLELGLLAR